MPAHNRTEIRLCSVPTIGITAYCLCTMSPLHFQHGFSRGLLITAVLAVLLPTGLALYLSHLSYLRGQQDMTTMMVEQVERRVSQISRQMNESLAELTAAHLADLCSQQGIAQMQRALIRKEMLTNIGLIQGNRLRCTAFGTLNFHLRSPAITNTAGYILRNDVRLPGAEDIPLVAVTDPATGVSLFAHKNTALDSIPGDLPWQVAITSLGKRPIVLVQRGYYDPRWPSRTDARLRGHFKDDSYLVAWQRSPNRARLTFVALPRNAAASSWPQITLLWVGLGFATGLLLAVVILRFAKASTSLRSLLRRAIKSQELLLEYQPVVELASGRWVGAEALLRWQRPNGETVSPALFIPIAEKSGLMSAIRERVLQLIEQDTPKLFTQHPDFHIALNLCAEDIASSELIPRLHKLLAHIKTTSPNLHIELTETSLIDLDVAQDPIAALRAAGFTIAIDDFGTGYSSLSYLAKLEFDHLKIDKSFVDTIGTGAVTESIISHIIEIAKSLHVPMIAEGVETQAQADYLMAHGVQYAQGWLYSKSIPMHSLLAQLHQRKTRLSPLAAASISGHDVANRRAPQGASH